MFIFLERIMMEVSGRIETLFSKLKGDKQPPPVEVVLHKSKKQRRQTRNIEDIIEKSHILNIPNTSEKTNLRKLQNEILKFTTHFDGQNTKAKEQHAIKLGAKPRKNNHLNYKQLKEKLKTDSESKKNQEQLFKFPKTMVRTSKTNSKRSYAKGNKQSIDIIKNYGTIKTKN